MTRLLALAREHRLTVIEDTSHAHGATWRGRKCGRLGDVGVFSLQGHKLAPAGEGGMFLTDRDNLYERAALLGDVLRIAELPSAARRFYATTYGVKTRMAPLSAAVARVQLRHLDARNARRNANLEYLSQRLERLGFTTYLPPPHARRVYFEYLVRPPADLPLPAAALIRALAAEGCDAQQPRYPLLHQQPLFTEGEYRRVARLPPDVAAPVYRPDALPRTAALNEQLIRLPTFPQADRALLDQYAEAFAKVLGHAPAVAVRVASDARLTTA
jgi:dTDP-4-amino-4,6-dideoxygalactose transaminase